jgi:DNA invertase Pin-like site-specific DNA recombinase
MESRFSGNTQGGNGRQIGQHDDSLFAQFYWRNHPPKRAKDGGKVFGYIRVSDFDRQQASDKVQADLISHRAKEFGVEPTLYVDYLSGSVKRWARFADRPDGGELLKSITEGDHLIIWKMDRLGRVGREILEILAHLQNQGINVYILNYSGGQLDMTTAVGKLIVHLLAGFAQFENDVKRERQLEHNAWRRAQGLPYHRWPLPGLRLVRHKENGRTWTTWERDEEDERTCEEIFRRHLGGESFQSIARDFARREMRRPNGQLWVHWIPAENRYYAVPLSKAYNYCWDRYVLKQPFWPNDGGKRVEERMGKERET